jgi:hypothetical protein
MQNLFVKYHFGGTLVATYSNELGKILAAVSFRPVKNDYKVTCKGLKPFVVTTKSEAYQKIISQLTNDTIFA